VPGGPKAEPGAGSAGPGAAQRSRLDSGVSAVTVAKAYRLLKAILNTTVDDGLIRRNPCRIKGAGQEKSAERPVLTVPQVYALADATNERYRVLVLLAAFTSLRWGELAALRALRHRRPGPDRPGCLAAERAGWWRFRVRAAEIRGWSAHRGDTRVDHAGPDRAPTPGPVMTGSCSPAPQAGRSGTPTSGAGSGYVPWRRPGFRRCTFMICAIPGTCSR
jgi:hypothetical protein